MEGYNLAVVDLHTQRMMAIGGTFEYVLPGARVIWLDDDRLLVAHHAGLFGGPSAEEEPASAAVIKIWRMVEPPDELLELERQVAVPARPGSLVAGLRQIDPQRVAFALLNPDVGPYQGGGLYLFNLSTNEARRLRSLTPMGQWDDTATARRFPEDLHWLPDGSGLLIHDAAQQAVLFAPAAGNTISEIGHLLGPNACCFTWVEPAASTPLAEIEPTAQITVPDVYAGDYHYRVYFSTAIWRLEQHVISEKVYPELVHLTIDGCRMGLREGARGLSPNAITVEKRLAGLTWSSSHEPLSNYPNYFIYTTHQPDKGISFLIRVETPMAATDEVKATCQAAAEAVLDTFTLVE
jgi:hypothetical protein